MAIRNGIDSDVDQLTALAIQGVTSFIAMYDDERPEPPRAAGTPHRRNPRRSPARASASRRRTRR